MEKEQQAAIAWYALINVAKKREKIRYNVLGKLFGVHYRHVGGVLELIQNYCLTNRMPPLTILVVNHTGKPGSGFAYAWDADNLKIGYNQVFNYDWMSLGNPFNYALTGATENDIIEALLLNPDNSRDVYAKIKVRGIAQTIFRKALLRAYNYKCAFCDFSFEEALKASHIVPWSKSEKSERLDVRNGILLCSNHHDLFDNFWLTVKDNYLIVFCNPDLKDKYSGSDIIFAADLHGKKMNLPIDKKHWPKKDYLKRHVE